MNTQLSKHSRAYLRLFLAIIGIILGTLAIQSHNEEIQARAASIVAVKTLEGIQTARSLERFYARKLDAFPIKQLPDTTHRPDSEKTADLEQKCKSTIYRTLERLPEAHSRQLKNLTLFYTDDGRRGLGGQKSIILRCKNIDDSELAAVLIHEMGHLVDEGYLRGKNSDQKSSFLDFGKVILADDPSIKLYKMSWLDHTAMLPDVQKNDFVSGYGMSDPFEEFAETYAFYVLHGEEFRVLSEDNEVLQKKYDFMREKVFGDIEYGNFVGEISVRRLQPYDVTVLPFHTHQFFNS